MNAYRKVLHAVRQMVRRYFHYRLYQKMTLPAITTTSFDSFGFSQPDGQIQTGNHHSVRD